MGGLAASHTKGQKEEGDLFRNRLHCFLDKIQISSDGLDRTLRSYLCRHLRPHLISCSLCSPFWKCNSYGAADSTWQVCSHPGPSCLFQECSSGSETGFFLWFRSSSNIISNRMPSVTFGWNSLPLPNAIYHVISFSCLHKPFTAFSMAWNYILMYLHPPFLFTSSFGPLVPGTFQRVGTGPCSK